MKKLIYACTSIALVALVGLASCKKSDNDSLSLSTTANEIEVGDEFTITAKNNNGTVKWEIKGDAGIIEITPSNDGKSCNVKGINPGIAIVVASDDKNIRECEVTVTTPIEPKPIVEPEAGKIKFLVNVPAQVKACNGVALIGGFCGFDASKAAFSTKATGTQTWYVITIDACDASTFGNSKICLVAEDGTTAYDFEGGEGAYELLEGADTYAAIGSDYGVDNCLNLVSDNVSNVVIDVKVSEFKGNPCVSKSTYTITLKMAYCGPDGETDVVPAVCGNFNSWDAANPIPMESAGNDTWTVQVEAQAGNEFKFQSSVGNWANEIQVYDEETGEWGNMSNIKLNDNLEQNFDYSNADAYKWSACGAAPFVPNEAQTNVTFTWNGQDGFELTEGDKLIFTGNFEEESWGASTREMTDNGDGTYSWTGDIPAAFECKIFVVTTDKDGNPKQVWGNEDNIKLSIDDTYPYSFDMSVDYPAAPEE